MAKYIRLCKTLADKGILIPSTDSVYKHIDDLNVDWYSSIYYYNEEHYKQFQEKSSISGITDVVTNKLVFDFDSKTDLDLAKSDALALCDKLINEGIPKKSISICYSGKKGISVVLNTDSEFTPEEHKTIAKLLCSDLETFDTVVYNASRVFRVPLSKHNDSEFYKYPLTYSELKDLSIEEIQAKARVMDVDKERYSKAFPETKIPDKILHLKTIKTTECPQKNKIELALRIEDINFRERPQFLSPSKYVLHLGMFKEGTRSVALMILASTYKKAGFNKEDAYRLLKSVCERQAEIYRTEKFPNDEIWNNIVSVVYSEQWKGGIYSEEQTELLTEINAVLPGFLRDTEFSSSLVTNDYLIKEFGKFLDEIDANTIKTGLKEFDKRIKILTGISYGVVGCPGSAKSSLSMNFLMNCSKNNEVCLYLSYDMPANLVTYRQMQLHLGWSDDEIKKLWQTNKTEFLDKYKYIQDNMFKNVYYSFACGSNTNDVKNEIIKFEEKTGKKIRLVVVDYLESLASEYSDQNVAAGTNAQKLTNIAMEQNVAMIILLQTQKTVVPGAKIESQRSAKLSSLIEQSVSTLIGISRPGQPTKYAHLDTIMHCSVLKNRMGSNGEFLLGWDGPFTRIRDINDQDRLNLAEIERLKEEEDNERRERFGGRVQW